MYDIIDCLPDEQFWWVPYFTLSVGTAGLLFTGYSRSMVSSPNGTSLNVEGNAFESFTVYQYDENATTIEHVKDVSATEFVTVFCILMWHGTWTLVDAFYDSRMKWEDSVWYSLAIGFGVSVILTVLQLPLLRMSRSTKVPFVAKFVANGAFSLVGCYATLESFRGVWYLMDAYYMTEDYKASLLTGGLFGVLGLLLFDMGPSLHPGISSDKGGLISFEYLVYHYIKEKSAAKPRMPVQQNGTATQ